MAPRARHADRETTDPFGIPPVPEATVPSPRRPEHSGGWVGGPATYDDRRPGSVGAYPPEGRTWVEPTPPRRRARPGRAQTDAGAAAFADPARDERWDPRAPDAGWDDDGPDPDDRDAPAPAVADRWSGTGARRRDAVPGDLFTPHETRHETPHEPRDAPVRTEAWSWSGEHSPDVDPQARPARAAGDVRPGHAPRAAGPGRPPARSRRSPGDTPCPTPTAGVPGAAPTDRVAGSAATDHDPASARRRPAAVEEGVRSGLPLPAVLVPVVVGSLVAVALGVWARQHEATGVAVNLAGFSSGAAAKAWLGSLALLLAVVQLVSGRMLHRGSDDPMTATVHRWSGRAAVLVTVPVAVQCLYAFGWSGATTSALLHSALGCLFYGAFVTKMLLLRRPGVPDWVLAATGGLLFAVLAGVWSTSALWFFTGNGLSF